ncbi:hypothetical protein TCAL_11732 [Tigriopus californicus]|uniref:Aldehyde dehydrogenase n=1 Tax=Tigriopus californicus TaxID=6832 RepID=A0A553PPI0_TIGCA|nr:aldehyde dehydrogenase, dimeric NADP-preferring-like [Tigriopus californicus]TRY79592.1 hypothetical protein TCAL_11732 [Tigriopus californicus]|eukprot:TCALIF_11732-PA protein Name:"Similar to ALDH3B1 Aldehyde dehydrogenase family 3 member B1 (Homo sapiens)" AED:0.15 eAED:0.15 QI:182/1/1/1/1/1/2/520/497
MDDYKQLLDTARNAWNSRKTRPIAWRKHQLEQFLKLLDENEEILVQALFQDLHKPKQEAITFEVEFTRNVIRGCLAQVDQWPQDEHVAKNLLTIMDTTFIRRDPYGVVLIMGAWNYPIQLSLVPVAGALVAGNCIFVKPSELAPHSAQVMTALFNQYMDRECCRAIMGGIPETTELLKHRFDYIFFTGSSRVGRVVGEAANKYLTPCTMELGGKCPAWIDKGINMDIAIKRIVWSKMANMGQTCVAPDYLLCSEEVRDLILSKIPVYYKQFFGSDAKASPDLCRIINDTHVQRLKRLKDKTKGTVVFGGHIDVEERFMDLTIITEISKDDAVMEEEIFGPILPIVTVNSVQEAAQWINEKPKPLSLYIFSDHTENQDYLIDNTSSGSVCLNDAIVQLSVETLPFGGVGDSGYGSYHGKYTFETFSHRKSVLKRDMGIIGETLGVARYPPYSDKKINTLKNLVKARKFPHIPGFSYMICIGIGFGLAWIWHHFKPDAV